jgi:predicted metal-dependent hydrolase
VRRRTVVGTLARVPADFPPGFDGGIRHFNAGRFFEAHEAFEELLDAVESDDRWDLLVALIQVAVGYHKCASGHPGAARMLGLGLVKLRPFPDDARGLALAALRARIADDVASLGAGRDVAARLHTDPPRLLPATPRERR